MAYHKLAVVGPAKSALTIQHVRSHFVADEYDPGSKKPKSEALQTGAVNEDAQEVVADLNRSLAEQPASTAALLEQPTRPASPVVPPPVMSLGPQPVTDHVRAEERAEERARRQAEEPCVVSGQKTVAPKKRKVVIPPELEERQKRASARMLELGVPPLQARIHFLLLVVVYLIKTCHLCNYLLYFSMYCLIFLSTYETFLCSVSSFTYF